MDAITSATIATAIATFALVIATIVLAVFTKKMADETSRAQVIVTIEPSPWAINLMEMVVSNPGPGIAFDVQIKMDPTLRTRDGKEIPLPLQNISVVNPGFLVRSYLRDYLIDTNESYKIEISWKRRPEGKRTQQIKYVLSLKSFEGYSRLGGGEPDVQIAESLKKISARLDKIGSGFSRFEVNTYAESDRAKEAEAMEQWLKSQSAKPETESVDRTAEKE